MYRYINKQTKKQAKKQMRDTIYKNKTISIHKRRWLLANMKFYFKVDINNFVEGETILYILMFRERKFTSLNP